MDYEKQNTYYPILIGFLLCIGLTQKGQSPCVILLERVDEKLVWAHEKDVSL